jgi:hypothetical protein
MLVNHFQSVPHAEHKKINIWHGDIAPKFSPESF